jgi:hypothetical protein
VRFKNPGSLQIIFKQGALICPLFILPSSIFLKIRTIQIYNDAIYYIKSEHMFAFFKSMADFLSFSFTAAAEKTAAGNPI